MVLMVTNNQSSVTMLKFAENVCLCFCINVQVFQKWQSFLIKQRGAETCFKAKCDRLLEIRNDTHEMQIWWGNDVHGPLTRERCRSYHSALLCNQLMSKLELIFVLSVYDAGLTNLQNWCGICFQGSLWCNKWGVWIGGFGDNPSFPIPISWLFHQPPNQAQLEKVFLPPGTG